MASKPSAGLEARFLQHGVVPNPDLSPYLLLTGGSVAWLTVTGPLTLSPGTTSSTWFGASGSFTGNARLMSFDNNSTANTTTIGFELTAGAGGGSRWNDCGTEYTVVAEFTGRSVMQNWNSGFAWVAEGAAGDFKWYCNVTGTLVLAMSLSHAGVLNVLAQPTINGVALDIYRYAVAAGSVDVLTATLAVVPTLVDGLLVRVKASGANTVVTPTFNLNGTGAKTITKFGGQALAVGDIRAAGHVLQLSYALAADKWELLNPTATGGVGGGTSNGMLSADFDGQGSDLTVGAYCDIRAAFGYTINDVELLGDAVGSVVIGVYADTYANFPPTSGDSITGAAPPTLAAARKSYDNTLTGWTPAVAAGKTIRLMVESCSGIKKLNVSMGITK